MWPMSWLKELEVAVRFDELLSRHTTFQIGGPADIWLEPLNICALRGAILNCRQKKIPYIVIGRGSNILFSDEGFRGAVIYLGSRAFTRIQIENSCVSCGAGAVLNNLIGETQSKGLSGLEFLAGIPASIGGAVIMNAGNQQECIGVLVKRVTVVDNEAQIKELDVPQLCFSYRSSNLAGYVVVGICLELAKSAPEKIKENISGYLQRKKKTQDLLARSAGCIFKNPAHCLSAGAMIDACGLKGRRCGGAEVSTKHGNFIINRNNAKASDILHLINLIQEEIINKFSVWLEPEITIIDGKKPVTSNQDRERRCRRN